jgi:hypothetical protein
MMGKKSIEPFVGSIVNGIQNFECEIDEEGVENRVQQILHIVKHNVPDFVIEKRSLVKLFPLR